MSPVIDIHPHIVSPDTKRYPLAPLGGKQSAWSSERPTTYQTLLKAMDEAGVAKADTRPTRDLAQAIESNVVTNEIFDSPAESLAIADKAFKALDPDKMRAAIVDMMRDRGPLVFLASPTPIEGGEAAVAAALEIGRASCRERV